MIRRGAAADAGELTELFLESRATAMPYLPLVHTPEETRWWMDNVVLSDTTVWVAEDEGASIFGFASLAGSMLEHLYLRPDARGRGIGTALLDVLRGASPQGLSLHVFQRNEQAIAFYLGHGFVVTDRNEGSRNEEHEPDQTMTWSPA